MRALERLEEALEVLDEARAKSLAELLTRWFGSFAASVAERVAKDANRRFSGSDLVEVDTTTKPDVGNVIVHVLSKDLDRDSYMVISEFRLGFGHSDNVLALKPRISIFVGTMKRGEILSGTREVDSVRFYMSTDMSKVASDFERALRTVVFDLAEKVLP